MTRSTFGVIPCLVALAFAASFLTACSDDDDFSPVSRNRGYDYAFTSTKNFADYPCNDVREGREAVVGREKESYYCQFDYRDSVYIWAGYDDTLTAYGKEFVRSDASSSSRGSSSSYDDDDNSSSSRYSSSYSSSRYSSSSYYSSSSRKKIDVDPRLTEKGEQFNSSITYGTMTDPRDGKKYKTVNINGQTWMAENLNYTDNEYGQAFCFNDEEEFCELYGRLYSREAAMNSPDCASGQYCELGNDPIQGICPEGWHIPTVDEATLLINYIGKDETDWASAKGWNPNLFNDTISDTYGLSFVPSGIHENKGFTSIDTVSFMWLYLPNGKQRYFVINAKTDEVFVHDYSSYVSIPVRCVKGEMEPFSSSSYSSSSARSSSSSYSGPWSSENPSSSFSISSKEDLLNPSLTYGTMTDPRDGKKYKTIEFNGQIWMAENLNYAGNEAGESFCFNDEDRFCDVYGRLYSRDAAMNDSKCDKTSCDLGDAPIQGVCPSGWHIPSKAEIDDLVNSVSENGLTLMSAEGWDVSMPAGTNTLGLSLVGSGDYDSSKHFEHLGVDAFLWLYSEGSQTYVVVRGEDSNIFVNTYTSSQLYNSVRCVKN